MTSLFAYTLRKCNKAPVKLPAKIWLAKHYNSVMIRYSFKEVRLAVAYRGFNEVDEVDEVEGRSPVERAAAASFPDLRRRCAAKSPPNSSP